ncbi:MAG: glycine oxidase ThiO [Ktedonobacteraceae bacterium]|nr:glycine oxidase ThiO [Ktedonobacteraceae bacterium]
MKTTDVVIIGGGVIGCAIAYFLRKQHIDVVLLERGEIGGQASGAAAGLLAPPGPLTGPGPFADLVLAGFASLAALVPELEASSGIHLGYERPGALRIVRDQKRVAHLQKRFANWQALGLPLYWLSGAEACQREPLLAPDVCAAVYSPAEAQIQASSVVQAFAQAAQLAGARIYPHHEVAGVLTQQDRAIGVYTTQGETITCNHLVLASGAWAAQCCAWFNVTLPVSPLHGQLIALSQPMPHLKHIIFGEAAYLAPKGETLFVGATREDMGFDTTVVEKGSSWLYETATRLIPALAQGTIQASWAGLRPRTPDRRPIVGFLPPWENVLVAAGHNSVGIILSALTGQCIAEMVTTGNTPPLMQNFTPGRFLNI